MKSLSLVQHVVRRHPWICVNYAVTAGLCMWAFQACLAPVTPAKQAADAAAVLACVQKDWGQPIAVIAADCVGDSIVLAEDCIADVEALLEGPVTSTADAAAPAVSAQAALFPYNTPSIRAKVDSKRLSLRSR